MLDSSHTIRCWSDLFVLCLSYLLWEFAPDKTLIWKLGSYWGQEFLSLFAFKSNTILVLRLATGLKYSLAAGPEHIWRAPHYRWEPHWHIFWLRAHLFHLLHLRNTVRRPVYIGHWRYISLLIRSNYINLFIERASAQPHSHDRMGGLISPRTPAFPSAPSGFIFTSFSIPRNTLTCLSCSTQMARRCQSERGTFKCSTI